MLKASFDYNTKLLFQDIDSVNSVDFPEEEEEEEEDGHPPSMTSPTDLHHSYTSAQQS